MKDMPKLTKSEEEMFKALADKTEKGWICPVKNNPCPKKLKGVEHPSCISCLQWDKKQFKICYPLLGQKPPNKDRFKHRSELQTVSSEVRGEKKK